MVHVVPARCPCRRQLAPSAPFHEVQNHTRNWYELQRAADAHRPRDETETGPAVDAVARRATTTGRVALRAHGTDAELLFGAAAPRVHGAVGCRDERACA